MVVVSCRPQITVCFVTEFRLTSVVRVDRTGASAGGV